MKKCLVPLILISIFIFFIAACANENTPEVYKSYQPETYGKESDDLTVHFLELGNASVGDCVYIKYGDVDIIIDAGSDQASATTIINYINNHSEDGKLEYVIATHAHADHIAAFTSWSYGTNLQRTGILDYYDIDLIIDFPKTNYSTIEGTPGYTGTYRNYANARERKKNKGTAHFTALQCYKNQGGAKRIYDLGQDVKLEILYNYYYENYSSNENNYSVCVRIIQGDKQYLFTGDLEHEGEIELVNYYESRHRGLGHCVLYKAGHHGSYTSSHDELMNAITPGYVCVCTCVGTTQYTTNVGGIFPTQAFIDRVAPHTDEVYLTTRVTNFKDNAFEPFNGNIVFRVSAINGEISVKGSNNDSKLKDTDWFDKNRVMPDAWK